VTTVSSPSRISATQRGSPDSTELTTTATPSTDNAARFAFQLSGRITAITCCSIPVRMMAPIVRSGFGSASFIAAIAATRALATTSAACRAGTGSG
jgi:hypothetical protein